MSRTLELHAIYEPKEEPTQIALDLENHKAVLAAFSKDFSSVNGKS